MEYNWAANHLKLQRAIAQAGMSATEDQVKAVYISLGGQVIEEEIKDDKPKHTKADKPAKKKRASSRR